MKSKTSATVSRIPLAGAKLAKQEARDTIWLEAGGDAGTRIALERLRNRTDAFDLIGKISLGDIDRKVKAGNNLTFEEAGAGMLHVIAATNASFERVARQKFVDAYGDFCDQRAIAMAAAFLNLMAAKESLWSLSAEEIAGMVAATSVDLAYRFNPPTRSSSVLETCGMGGDRGFTRQGRRFKSINVSTLSAAVASTVGVSALKHGSYGNTSAVGSTDAIESLGAKVAHGSLADVLGPWQQSGFAYLDAHASKTVHDLSHLLRMETVNHVIGPMTPPLASDIRVSRIMGVNEKVHPATVVRAYAILHERGFANVGGLAVVAGLERGARAAECVASATALKDASRIDELSPYESVVAVGFGQSEPKLLTLAPESFGIRLDESAVLLPSDDGALARRSNLQVLAGSAPDLAAYLAMNAALGVTVARAQDLAGLLGGLNALAETTAECLEAIRSGRTGETVRRYVEATGGEYPA